MSLETRIRELSLRFIASLMLRVNAMADALRRVDPAAPHGEALTLFVALAHTVAGTAGSYGLHEVSLLAREAEVLCDTAAIDDATLRHLDRIVRDLHDVTRRHTEELQQSGLACAAGGMR
jgi:HPt (histidine-containing phosphotransfer) domain-containing protein